ncbi:helix-turn-helix domain-containing protein [Variovorax sp. RTB1]|uniref:helix-turn-helix domain-containing protein n=1 Tax=Variovorax sp. RTB1 TaxID=3048631 RepID=UPI003A59941D
MIRVEHVAPYVELVHSDSEGSNQELAAKSKGKIDLQQIAKSHLGSRLELARHLGISERTLYRRLKDLPS